MISLCMIVRNEQELIARCLNSVKGLVDEVIMVDHGSTDATITEAQKAVGGRLKVVYHEWKDDFADSRNFSFSLATKDWILWLDADDIVRATDCNKIVKAIQDNPTADGFFCNYIFDHDIHDKPILTLARERIFRNNKKAKWLYPIHECVETSLLKMVSTDIDIHHYRTSVAIAQDGERNIKILKKAIEGKYKNDARMIGYYANALRDVGKTEEALPFFKRHVPMAFDPEIKFMSQYQVCWCLHALGRDEESIVETNKAIQMDPERAEPYFNLGEIYCGRRNWTEAIVWYKKSYIPIPNRMQALLPALYTYLPCSQLALCYNQLNNTLEARRYTLEALKFIPENAGLKNDITLYDAQLNLPETIKLNLGCGGQRFPQSEGWINVDPYEAGADAQFNLWEIPYGDGTVDEIHSEHSLEHVPKHLAERALKEWARALKPNGKLTVKVPDIEECMKNFLSADEDKRYGWWIWTIFGRQVTNGIEDRGQFHQTGFTRERLTALLNAEGLLVSKVWSYDGCDTPSFGIEAIKPIKVWWRADPNNKADPSNRIRRLNINAYLKGTSLVSSVSMVYDDGLKADVIVMTGYGGDEIAWMKKYKEMGKKVLYDHCEYLTDPGVNEVLKEADVVVCCSTKLAELTKPINPNVVVIKDAIE